MPNQKDTAVDNYFALFRSPRKEGNGADGPEPHPPPKANWGGVFSSVMLSLGSQPSTLEPKAGSSRSGEGGSRPPPPCVFVSASASILCFISIRAFFSCGKVSSDQIGLFSFSHRTAQSPCQLTGRECRNVGFV